MLMRSWLSAKDIELGEQRSSCPVLGRRCLYDVQKQRISLANSQKALLEGEIKCDEGNFGRLQNAIS